MDSEKIVPGFILLVIGGINVVKPYVIIEFQKWTSKIIYGAEYRPSRRTYHVQRIVGIIILILGFSIIVF